MIEVAWTQHSGKQHRVQQDTLWNGSACVQSTDLPTKFAAPTSSDLLLAIADGVATSPTPHLASRFAIETLAELSATADLSIKLVRQLQLLLCDRYATGRTRGTATTLVAASFTNENCQIVNIGDSRAYRIAADGRWTQLSRDHTILNDLIEAGEADADADTAYASIYDGLAHCLIADDEEDDFSAHACTAPFLAGDSLLLCSDGLHDVLGDRRLQSLCDPSRSCQEQVAVWRSAVLSAGAPDNVSIILARRRP